MKKIIFLLLFTLGWQIAPSLRISANAEVKPVFPYNYPSKEIIRSLVIENSSKGKAFGDYLLSAVNLGLADTTLVIKRGNINILFDNLFSEEFVLQDGEYLNSGYDNVSRKMIQSLGHKWQGFIWTFKVGTYTIRLIKADCGNILVAKTIRTKVSPIKKSSCSYQRAPKKYQEARIIEKVVVKRVSSPPQEIRWKNVVIPIAAIVAASVYYLSRRSFPSSSPSLPSCPYHDNGQGQDPPPSGENGGSPVDPPPSGD